MTNTTNLLRVTAQHILTLTQPFAKYSKALFILIMITFCWGGKVKAQQLNYTNNSGIDVVIDFYEFDNNCNISQNTYGQAVSCCGQANGSLSFTNPNTNTNPWGKIVIFPNTIFQQTFIINCQNPNSIYGFNVALWGGGSVQVDFYQSGPNLELVIN